MDILRRRVLSGGSATVLLAACGQNEPALTEQPPVAVAPPLPPTPPVETVDDEIAQIFLAESFNEGASETANNEQVASWKEIEADPDLLKTAKSTVSDVATGKLTAAVVDDANSPDYVRFATPECGKDGELCRDTFTLNDATLRSIAQANGYMAALAGKQTVMFGLRGCALPGDDNSSASGQAIQIREASVDHVRRRCLIGVWDTSTGNIQVFSGSTVPNLVNMQYYIYWRAHRDGLSQVKWTLGRTMACLLPQGLHTFSVGVHLRNESAPRQQAGALLQGTKTPIMRAKNDVGFTLQDQWDPLDWEPGGSEKGVRLVGANIHAGVNRNMPPYASKGCQTIFGWYADAATPAKLWKDFQSSLGIVVSADAEGNATFTRKGATFPYMLTTGRDARLHAVASGDNLKLDTLRRLRLGSKGAGAIALRKFLNLEAGDTINGEAVLALLKWQKANDLAPDGALTRQLDTDWNVGAF